MIFFDNSRVRNITFGEREVLKVYFEGVQVFGTSGQSDSGTKEDAPQSDSTDDEG